jgi:hypothetical protein
MMSKFDLDTAYLTDVTVRQSWGMYAHKKLEELETDEVIKILKGLDQCSSTSTVDHPEFAKLRDQLEQDSYIETQRGWWNGDRVLKPFVFNGVEFRAGDQFCCASAMSGHLKFAKKYKK